MILDRFGRPVRSEPPPPEPASDCPKCGGADVDDGSGRTLCWCSDEPAGERHPAVRALLTALGFDPDKHTGQRKTQPHRGLVVVNLAGKPVRFFTARQLMKLRKDENVVRDFADALTTKPPPTEGEL